MNDLHKHNYDRSLSLEEIVEKNIKMVETNRFMTKEEKEIKKAQLKQAQGVEDLQFKALLKNPLAPIRGKAAFQQMAMKKFKEQDFEGFKECYRLSQPLIENIDLIPIIVGEIERVYPINVDNYPIIIAVIYYLIAPFKNIHHDVKLLIGIRDKIQLAMGFANPESVNAYSLYILPMYKNPRWKEKVHQLGDQVYNDIKTAGYLEEGAWEKD